MKRALAIVTFLVGCAHQSGRIVRSVEVRGLPPVDSDELHLATRKTIWPKTLLNEVDLEADRARIARFLEERGYFDARVSVNERAGEVVFRVEPGAPTKWRQVAVPEGVKLKAGDRFNHESYLKEKRALEARWHDKGYAFAEARGEIAVDRAAHAADVKLTVNSGPQVLFGHVEVEGTAQVDAVIRRVSISEGTPFRPDALVEAEKRLREVGLFSSIEIECRRRDDFADVIVKVSESKPNELKIGAGFGLEAQRSDVHAQLAWTRRNFLGGLRTLKLRIAPAYVATPAFWDIARQGLAGTVEAQFTQPDRPWRQSLLAVTVGYDVGIDYGWQYHGPRLELLFAQALWHDRVQLALGYDFQSLFFFDTDKAILDDPEKAVYGYVDPYRLGFWQQKVALDLRDRPLDPKKGAYAAVNAEEGGEWAGGAFSYEKVQPELRGYLPLGEKVVFAARAEYEHLFSQGDSGSPITRRFYLGGPNSHRGFSYDRLSPQVGSSRLPVGGDQMVLLSAELRSDLVEQKGYGFGMALFVDAGDVNRELDMTKLHCATGGGVRLKTQLGTLRADVGVRLNRLAALEPDGAANPDPGQRVAFHVSFGEAF